MAAAQRGKKTHVQRRMKHSLNVKPTHKKIQPKQKNVQPKQGKKEQKKVAEKKVKDPGYVSERSKVPQEAHQKKALLPAKGNRKSASLGKKANSLLSSQARCPKLGRNICTLSAKDLQYEVNEMMRRELTTRMFASSPRVLH